MISQTKFIDLSKGPMIGHQCIGSVEKITVESTKNTVNKNKLPEINSSPQRIDGWKMKKKSFWVSGRFSWAFAVSFRTPSQRHSVSNAWRGSRPLHARRSLARSGELAICRGSPWIVGLFGRMSAGTHTMPTYFKSMVVEMVPLKGGIGGI